MMYKFTKSAEEAIETANDLAIELGHDYVGTEHILYGLAKTDNSVAAKVLEAQNVTADDILERIEELIGRGEERHSRSNWTYTKDKKSCRKCIYGSKKTSVLTI